MKDPLTHITNLASLVAGKLSVAGKFLSRGRGEKASIAVVLVRIASKSALIVLISHVLFTWPSGFKIFTGDVDSFREWVENISLIPTPMWGIISTIIIGVATQQIITSHRDGKRREQMMPDNDESEGEG